MVAMSADGFSAMTSVSSSYPYRGYSKSDNGPTARANLDYSHRSGWFAGTWAARVDFGDRRYRDRANIEFYPYVGFGFAPAERLRLEASVARYVFDGPIFGRPSDYNEYRAEIRYSDWLSAKFEFADDGYHRGGTILNSEISARYPLTANVSASAGIAYNHANISLINSALHWNLGLTWFYRFLALDIRYVDDAALPTPTPSYSGYYRASLPELRQNFVFTLSAGF
jgi:uncharacterized protein (TIGR02001 family)